MITKIKSQLGALPLAIALTVIIGLCAGFIIYRQIKSVKTSPQVQPPSQALQDAPGNQPLAKKTEMEIKEWGVKLIIPAEYATNLYYELSNLDVGSSAAGYNQQPGRDVSFSFKSITADYPECAPYYNRVALLRRTPAGQDYNPLPPEQFTVKPVKRLGDYSYSYILPRQACIEGSFPYHDQHRQLYDQFRASFPALAESLELATP